MNDNIIDSRGIQRKLSGIEDSKNMKTAKDPMEMVITKPDTISSGLLPALSTKVIDTASIRYNLDYQNNVDNDDDNDNAMNNNTACKEKLNYTHNSCAGVFINAATNSLKDMDSLENNHIDSRPVLEKVKHKGKEKWTKILIREEGFCHELNACLCVGGFIFLTGHGRYLFARTKLILEECFL